jgi:hypothetical protein
METASLSRYADWYAKNREHALAYKRAYYKTHPEFAERKKQQARERYYAKKELTNTSSSS